MGDRIRANISTMSREFADMENLQKAAQNSLDELVEYISALVAAQNEYQNCEQQVESRISSIRV